MSPGVLVADVAAAAAAAVVDDDDDSSIRRGGGVVGGGGTFSSSSSSSPLAPLKLGPLKLSGPAGDGMTVSLFLSGVEVAPLLLLLLLLLFCDNLSSLDSTDSLVSNSWTRSSRNFALDSRSSNSASRWSNDCC